MLDIIMRAGCFVTIIVMGYILRKKKFLGDKHYGKQNFLSTGL